MADPLLSSQPNRPSFVSSLAGHNSFPIIPDAFFKAHLEDKNDLAKIILTSDASDRTWEVKLTGRRFAGGWEDFSAAHCLRDDDVLIFRHDGAMVFHVTPSGRSFSQIKCISSSSDDDDDDDDDDEGEEDDEDLKNVSSRLKTEFCSSEKSCLIGVTSSNLRLNRVNLLKDFARANGLNKRWCKIDLINQSGKSWALDLRHNQTTGQDYISGGWRSFCRENELKPGSLYRFEIVRNGTRPLLRLCSQVIRERNCSKANVSEKYSREGESASMNQNKFLTVTFKDYMIKSGHIRLPRPFVRANGMKEKEEITLVDKTGVKWPSYLAFVRERREFYMSKSWRRFCAANMFKEGETFTLEFVRGEGTTPMLKFCSKVKVEQVPFDDPQGTVQASRDNEEEEEEEEEKEFLFQKRARVSAEGPSRCTRASNKSSADPGNLQSLQPCSISDQVTKVKQSVLNTLTNIRMFRSELKIKEQNLEASLLEIETLGEKVLKISKILE